MAFIRKRNLLLFLLLPLLGLNLLHIASSLEGHQHTVFLEHAHCSISDHTFILDSIGLSTRSLLPQTGLAHPEPIILHEQEVLLSLFMPP